MPGRKYTSGSSYRYGFNGKENDNDISKGGQDYGMRIYDTRLGKFLSVDPLFKSFPWYTPYQFAGNTPIQAIDLDGEEEKHYSLILNKNGSATLTNIPSKTKEYNEIPLWLRIITLGAPKSKYKIQPRAVVTYGSNTYKIGFASSTTNLYKMDEFNEILKNPNNVDPDAFTSTFYNEDQDGSVAWFTFAVNVQNNSAMYGPLTTKAWFTQLDKPEINIGTTISKNRQLRHLPGNKEGNMNVMSSIKEAQQVLDAFKTGKAQLLNLKDFGPKGGGITQVDVKFKDVTQSFYTKDLKTGLMIAVPTNNFRIEGTGNKVKVFPINPTK